MAKLYNVNVEVKPVTKEKQMRGEWIKKMQRANKANEAALVIAYQGLTDLIALMNSDKFKVDTMVQCADIVTFAQQLSSSITDKKFEVLNEPLPVKTEETKES
jgi:hypothetical protein